MPNRTRAGKCINAVSAAANEFGMMKKGKPKKNTALQIETAVAGLCKGKLYPRITARRHKACGLAPAPAIRTYIADKTD